MLPRAVSASGSSDGDDRSEASGHSTGSGVAPPSASNPIKLYPSNHRVSMTKYSCLAPGDPGFGQLVLSSPKTKARRQAKNPELRAAAQAAAQAAQNNSNVNTAYQAAASKPIMSKISSTRRGGGDAGVGPTRKASLGKAPGHYSAPIHRSASATQVYQPYSMSGAAPSTRYSPYGSYGNGNYYSTPTYAIPASYPGGSSRGYTAPIQRQTSYSAPPFTNVSYASGQYASVASSTRAAAGLMSLTTTAGAQQNPSLQRNSYTYPVYQQYPPPTSNAQAFDSPAGPPHESMFDSPGGRSDAPSSDASSLDFGESPRVEPQELISRSLDYGEQQNYQRAPASWSGYTQNTRADYSSSIAAPEWMARRQQNDNSAGAKSQDESSSSIPTSHPRLSLSLSLPSLSTISSYSESSLRNTFLSAHPQSLQPQDSLQSRHQVSPAEYNSNVYRFPDFTPALDSTANADDRQGTKFFHLESPEIPGERSDSRGRSGTVTPNTSQ
ncbi:hypothetical protein P7C70_g2943, partial [Phenoliferia sp. Uapishka_3]